MVSYVVTSIQKEHDVRVEINLPATPIKDIGFFETFLNRYASLEEVGTYHYYGDMYRCDVLFWVDARLVLDCSYTQTIELGLEQESLALKQLLESLFGLEEVSTVVFLRQKQNASVFLTELVLPNEINRDFMKKLSTQNKAGPTS